jgi:chromate transporter
MANQSRLREIFLTFARIGAFTFGGGYAMLSLIEHECVEKKGWMTSEEMLEMTVTAESTPGPMAINCATFVGYRQAGLPGALAGTVGMILPSFLILYIISMFLDDVLALPLVAHAFLGIKVAVGILILSAGIRMIRKMKNKTAFTKAMLCASAAAMLLIDLFSWKISTITLILFAALIGLALTALSRPRGGKEERK